MTSREFCYWLQGYFEISCTDKNKESQAKALSMEQTQAIRNHLNMVFKHEIDPSAGSVFHQDQLTNIHSGGLKPGVDDVRIKC